MCKSYPVDSGDFDLGITLAVAGLLLPGSLLSLEVLDVEFFAQSTTGVTTSAATVAPAT